MTEIFVFQIEGQLAVGDVMYERKQQTERPNTD